MKDKELMLYSISYFESTLIASDTLLEFYLTFYPENEMLNETINNLINGFSRLIDILPQFITGKFDKVNYKDELNKLLEEIQVKLLFPEENADEVLLLWKKFMNTWRFYKGIILDMINNDHIIQIFSN